MGLKVPKDWIDVENVSEVYLIEKFEIIWYHERGYLFYNVWAFHEGLPKYLNKRWCYDIFAYKLSKVELISQENIIEENDIIDDDFHKYIFNLINIIFDRELYLE